LVFFHSFFCSLNSNNHYQGNNCRFIFFLSLPNIFAFVIHGLYSVVDAVFSIQFIWFIFPIADAITLIVSYLIIRVAYKELDILAQENSINQTV